MESKPETGRKIAQEYTLEIVERLVEAHDTLRGDIIIQVNKKFCELKGVNIGIVEKPQETRFGMS